MRRKLAVGVASVALIMLSGCHKGAGSAPTGQVVASVDGQEVTQREVSAELSGFSSQDENATKKAQQSAVQAILNRKLLAKAQRCAAACSRGSGSSPAGDWHPFASRARRRACRRRHPVAHRGH